MNSMLRRLLRRAHARTATGGTAAALRLELELMRPARAPVLVPPPTARRVLVLAPHIDDEVLGCGGTLAACAARSTDVHIAYMTDGSKGYANAAPPGGPLLPHERRLVELRKEEARRAAKILGWAELFFLGQPDGALAVSEPSIGALARVLQKTRPEIVCLPFLTDLHPDHWATNGIFVQAAARARLKPGTPCWGYEVWQPVPANTIVDIGVTMARKRNALQEFTSQIGEVDYPRACEALAAYRSLHLGSQPCGQGRGFAEAFYVADLALYSRLYGVARDGF